MNWTLSNFWSVFTCTKCLFYAVSIGLMNMGASGVGPLGIIPFFPTILSLPSTLLGQIGVADPTITGLAQIYFYVFVTEYIYHMWSFKF